MLNQPMGRDAYRALMHRLRSDLRDGLKRNPYFRVSAWVEINGTGYSVFISAERGRTVEREFRTSLLSERPRRQLAAGALAWAGRYRRDAARGRYQRGLCLQAHAACIAEAKAYRTAFNRLPG